MDSGKMSEASCRNPANILVVMAREFEALVLDPLPIRVIVGSTKERIANIGGFVASEKDFDL